MYTKGRGGGIFLRGLWDGYSKGKGGRGVYTKGRGGAVESTSGV